MKKKNNILPELPRVLNKREANFSLKFREWIEKNPRFSCTLEIKQTTTDSIPFSDVGESQLAYGLRIKSDEGVLIRVIGTNGEPDYIWCRNMPAFIVIKYPKGFVLIDVETFILEKNRSKRKSLTWDRAKDICTIDVKKT